MLLLKPNCESCNKDLPADSRDALICSFECTFCTDCMQTLFDYRCPNCNGPVSLRPQRLGKALQNNPASTERVRSDYTVRTIDGDRQIVRNKR